MGQEVEGHFHRETILTLQVEGSYHNLGHTLMKKVVVVVEVSSSTVVAPVEEATRSRWGPMAVVGSSRWWTKAVGVRALAAGWWWNLV